MKAEMDIAPQQPGYPCSPHCEGYLSERRMRAVLRDIDRLTDERGGYADPDDALRAIKRMVHRALSINPT
jgi:hypothetical protein